MLYIRNLEIVLENADFELATILLMHGRIYLFMQMATMQTLRKNIRVLPLFAPFIQPALKCSNRTELWVLLKNTVNCSVRSTVFFRVSLL
jgi:hypothetical protein